MLLRERNRGQRQAVAAPPPKSASPDPRLRADERFFYVLNHSAPSTNSGMPSPAALQPLTRFEWLAIDYAALEAVMTHADETIRRMRR